MHGKFKLRARIGRIKIQEKEDNSWKVEENVGKEEIKNGRRIQKGRRFKQSQEEERKKIGAQKK